MPTLQAHGTLSIALLVGSRLLRFPVFPPFLAPGCCRSLLATRIVVPLASQQQERKSNTILE
jgi:hypothetical protein